MSFQRVPLANFSDEFSTTTELSSVALGGRVISVSDEFFAEAFQLLRVEPSSSLKGQFGSNGALYDGWESRRHNPDFDWCIIRLGTTGIIAGFDVDTSHFNGNEAPQVSVEVLHGSPSEEPLAEDVRWSEVLARVDVGPNSRHLFKVAGSTCANYVKLNMYPDGGIARFRVYGFVSPVVPSNETEIFDLAHVFAGGRVEYTSDQHFGIGANLILPGRGKNMGDGWETKRSRQKGHKDWVIIKLGVPGILEQVELDTAHFKGNFPDSCNIHGAFHDKDIDWKTYVDGEEDWTMLLPRTKLGPHKQHYFQLENVERKRYTHIKLTIYPDGGLQRIRIMGHKAGGLIEPKAGGAAPIEPPSLETAAMLALSTTRIVPVFPLAPESFSPFGQVIQAYKDHTSVPKGINITPANGGSATKFHKLSLLESSYPTGIDPRAGISVYRCQPTKHIADDRTLELGVLERHPFTNQAFIPMGQDESRDPDARYLVVVANSGKDGRPDLETVRAFIASTAQGIVYKTGLWHQPMTTLGKVFLDFACVETQIGDGSMMDCEVLEIDKSLLKLKLPTL